MVLVIARAGGAWGLGYSYTDASAAQLIESQLKEVAEGTSALAPPAAWQAMVRAVRNLGRQGLAANAIAAVDVALWDLKGRLLDLPLAILLGPYRKAPPVYGSGGFTSYPIDRLQAQLAGWIEQGIRMVKMKIGSEPNTDLERVRAAREAIGPDAELFVDANGAYHCKQALAFADALMDRLKAKGDGPQSSAASASCCRPCAT